MKRLAAFLFVAVLLTGCSSGIVRPKVEKGIENALAEYIGPAKEYKVDAAGSELSMINGLIKHLRITGKDVLLAPYLTVADMLVDMDQVRYDPSSRKLTSVDSTVFTATITEDAVNGYIEQTQDADLELAVAMEKDKVAVEFVPKFVGLDVLIRVTGKPEIVGKNKVNFVADAGSVAHLPVPAYLVNRALDKINPILDLSTMRFPVNLTGITVKSNSAVIHGNAVLKSN